jgi:outer membrane protein assembly factor BamB
MLARPTLVLAVAAVAASCQAHVTTAVTLHAIDELYPELEHLPGGRLLGTISNAEGRDIVELPSGDLVVAGAGTCGFVARLAPTGAKQWLTGLPSCSPGGARVAAVDDDTLYASFVDGATSVVRLDHRGRVAWRVNQPEKYPLVAPIAATRELVAVAGRHHVFAVTPDGHLAWQVDLEPDEGKRALVRAIWIAGRVVVALFERDTGSALLGFDAATGARAWQIVLPGDDPPDWLTDPGRFAVSPTAGVFAVRAARGKDTGWTITELDPRTGATGWQRWLDERSADQAVLQQARYDDVRLALRLELANDGFTWSRDIFVGVDPASGRMLRFAEPELTGDVVNPSYLEFAAFALGGRGLLVTGSFYDRLDWEGLRATSPHHREGAERAEEVTMYFARVPAD